MSLLLPAFLPAFLLLTTTLLRLGGSELLASLKMQLATPCYYFASLKMQHAATCYYDIPTYYHYYRVCSLASCG